MVKLVANTVPVKSLLGSISLKEQSPFYKPATYFAEASDSMVARRRVIISCVICSCFLYVITGSPRLMAKFTGSNLDGFGTTSN